MSQLRAILIRETEKARPFKIVDREVWIPRSVVKTITKFAPDANGHRECILDCEDWFTEKEGL
jgi:hypothetical protein